MKCNKCNSTKLFLLDKGVHHGLYCKECGSWVKWVSNKNLDVIKEIIKEGK